MKVFTIGYGGRNREDFLDIRMLELCGDLLTGRLTGIPEPYCLLCAEKKVAECHRLQLAQYLERHKGAEVIHLE